MHYLALATDYDGTIADDRVVDKPTLVALARLRGFERFGAARPLPINGLAGKIFTT